MLYFWQVLHRDANRILIINVGMGVLAIQLLELHISLYAKFPLMHMEVIAIASSPIAILEIEVVSLSSIAAFFVAAQKLI